MRGLLLIACVCTVLVAVGAFLAGRATREEPRAPVSRAAAVKVEPIEVEEWEIGKTSLPSLVTPEPTAASSSSVAPTVPEGGGTTTTTTPPAASGQTTVPPPVAPAPEPDVQEPSESGGEGGGITVGPGDAG